MPESTNNSLRPQKISSNPKIKLLKKNARKRSSLENFETNSSYGDLEEIMNSVTVDTLLDTDAKINHLQGRYERFWLEYSKKIIHKDILLIRPNGSVIIKSLKRIYHGEAHYLLNSLLQINITTLNDELPIALTVLAYIGRHEIENIECLHALSLSSGPDFSPTISTEVLVPVLEHDGLILPQVIEAESLEFLKLTHRYPELYPTLQRKITSAPAKVIW